MAVKKTNAKKKITKNIDKGCVHIHASFNNTIVTVTDEQGNAIAACSAGELKFRGSRKSTPFGQGVRKRPGLGQRIGNPRDGSRGLAGHGNQRRFAHTAQRLQTAQTPQSLRR